MEEKPYLSHGICEDQLKTLQKIEKKGVFPKSCNGTSTKLVQKLYKKSHKKRKILLIITHDYRPKNSYLVINLVIGQKKLATEIQIDFKRTTHYDQESTAKRQS